MSFDPQDLIILFSRGVAQRRLFGEGHPKVEECQRDFLNALADFFSSERHETFFVGVEDGRLVYRGRFLPGTTIVGGKLVELAESLCCGGFTFRPGVDAAEVRALISLAAELADPVLDLETARALLAARGIRRVELAAEYLAVDQFDPSNRETWEGEQTEDELSAVMITKAMFEAVDRSHGRAAQGRALDVDGVRGVAERLAVASAEGSRDLLQMVRYPDYDTYTVGHSVRLAVLAVMVARTQGFEQSVLTELGAAGLLHDVGKSRIPEEILFKPGRLDAEESRIMNTHASVGAEILLEHREASPMVVAAAWGHHLQHGGGGYPETTVPQVRSWITAMLQVCDIFEALTAVRPYKVSLTPRRAYEIMAANIGIFDPAALQAFCRAVGLYPPGCRVKLNDGGAGIVLAAGQRMDRPRIHREAGPGVDPTSLFVDLSTPEQGHLEVVELICNEVV